MQGPWSPPRDHPISEACARELIGGDLGDVWRQIIMGCCRPIYWFSVAQPTLILANGSVTFIRTPARLLGVTAAHVLEEMERASTRQPIRVQIANHIFNDWAARRIDADHRNDLATLDLSNIPLAHFGNDVVPLESWPPLPPVEGRAIAIGGYPGRDRRPVKLFENNWGLFTALGIARTVSDDQITWIVPPESDVNAGGVQELPPNYDLGGISGGPLIATFETRAGIATYRLSGIVSEAQATLEYVVAKRLDGLGPDGTFR